MSYNFKSIADVEVVAELAESANILIEENGVIKKTPKTAVDKEEWDLDVVCYLVSISDYDQNWEYDIRHVNSYSNILAKLEAGIEPKARIIFNNISCSNETTNDYYLYKMIGIGSNRGWEYWQEYGDIYWTSYTDGMFGANVCFNRDGSVDIEAYFD